MSLFEKLKNLFRKLRPNDASYLSAPIVNGS